MAIESFNDNQLKEISNVLANAVTHPVLSAVLQHCGITEQGGTPKWERILLSLSYQQKKDRCGNHVGAFIQTVIEPVRFVDCKDKFNDLRNQLNEIIAFSGLHLGEDGQLKRIDKARTLTEAQERAGRLKAELLRRKVHSDVLRFCEPEFLQENYFHATFEATKSVADKIRDLTGLTGDGVSIVDKAFGINAPLLALNSLRTETEKSEQTDSAISSKECSELSVM